MNVSGNMFMTFNFEGDLTEVDVISYEKKDEKIIFYCKNRVVGREFTVTLNSDHVNIKDIGENIK